MNIFSEWFIILFIKYYTSTYYNWNHEKSVSHNRVSKKKTNRIIRYINPMMILHVFLHYGPAISICDTPLCNGLQIYTKKIYIQNQLTFLPIKCGVEIIFSAISSLPIQIHRKKSFFFLQNILNEVRSPVTRYHKFWTIK